MKSLLLATAAVTFGLIASATHGHDVSNRDDCHLALDTVLARHSVHFSDLGEKLDEHVSAKRKGAKFGLAYDEFELAHSRHRSTASYNRNQEYWNQEFAESWYDFFEPGLETFYACKQLNSERLKVQVKELSGDSLQVSLDYLGWYSDKSLTGVPKYEIVATFPSFVNCSVGDNRLTSGSTGLVDDGRGTLTCTRDAKVEVPESYGIAKVLISIGKEAATFAMPKLPRAATCDEKEKLATELSIDGGGRAGASGSIEATDYPRLLVIDVDVQEICNLGAATNAPWIISLNGYLPDNNIVGGKCEDRNPHTRIHREIRLDPLIPYGWYIGMRNGHDSGAIPTYVTGTMRIEPIASMACE